MGRALHFALCLLVLLCCPPLVAAQPTSARMPNLRLKYTSDKAANDNFIKLDSIVGRVLGSEAAPGTIRCGQLAGRTGIEATIHCAQEGQATFALQSHSNVAGNSTVIAPRRSRGTLDAPTAPQAGDILFTLAVQGYTPGDATPWDAFGNDAAFSLEVYAAETFDATHNTTTAKFFTTNGTTLVNNLYLDNGGAIATPGLLMGAIGAPLAVGHLYNPFAGIKQWIIESETTNDNPITELYQNRITTTDATPTVIHQLQLADDRAAHVTIKVLARCTGGSCTVGQALSCTMEATVKNVAGTSSLVGSNTYTHCNSDLTGVASGGGGGGAGADTCQEACTFLAGGLCGFGAGGMCVVATGLSSNATVWHLVDFKLSYVNS